MSTINVSIVDQNLTITNAPTIAAGDINVDVVEFEFDESWDGFGCVAVFWRDGDPAVYRSAIYPATGRAVVPHEVMTTEGRICFGVVGQLDSKTKTSCVGYYDIKAGALTTGIDTDPPSTGIYEQMLNAVGAAREAFAAAIIQAKAAAGRLVVYDGLASDLPTASLGTKRHISLPNDMSLADFDRVTIQLANAGKSGLSSGSSGPLSFDTANNITLGSITVGASDGEAFIDLSGLSGAPDSNSFRWESTSRYSDTASHTEDISEMHAWMTNGVLSAATYIDVALSASTYVKVIGYYIAQSEGDDGPDPAPAPAGSKTKMLCFDSPADYMEFVAENPGVLAEDDIIIIQDNDNGVIHNFYSMRTINETLTLYLEHTIREGSGGGTAATLPGLGSGFGTCASALSTTAKVVTITGFVRTQGVPFTVKFTNGAKNGDTLDVRSSSSSSSGTGAASLYYNGAAIPNGLIGAGAVATLYYDGTNYIVLSVDGVEDGFGVCSGNGTARAVTITGLLVKTGTRISVRFDTYDLPASATLNVNSYGAKAIRKDGAAIAAGVISSGDVATFVYDGTYWQLAGVMPANPASGGDSNVFITMSRSGSTVTASKNAAQIYSLASNSTNLVLIDEAGRECDLCAKPMPGSGQYSPAKFKTLDAENSAIIVYSVYDGTGEVTSESISIYSKDSDGIPQTDLAKETVTITASGDPVTYASDKTFAQISAAKTAGKEIEVFFRGFKGNCMDVGQNAATFEVTDATIPASPVKYIFVVSGTGCAGAASNWGGGGGSGVELFEVHLSYSGTTLIASETVADIVAAYQAGKLVKYYNDVGAEGLLFAAPTAYGVNFVCFDDSDGGHPTMMTVYSIAADGTVTAAADNILNSLVLPTTLSRTAAQMASGLLAVSNVVYTVTGDATGFVLTNSTNPIAAAGECVEIRLTVGSTAITTPTWPSWANLMNGWDGNFSASTYYDIVIDDAGNVFHSTREVSA